MTWGACFALVKQYGAGRISAAVYRNGAPPTIGALAELIEEDDQQKQWQTYVADVCCLMVNMLTKEKKFPYYSELISKRNPAYDNRSGEEIRQSVIAKLRRRRGERR